jgi:3-phosphoshikimate 1-carboxyvinyltransferase
MQAIVSPSQIKGSVTASASKSAMQRACAAALLKKGKTILVNPGSSADDLAAIDIITQLGAKVRNENERLIIESQGIRPISQQLNCGESGLSIRMFTSIAALSSLPITIIGTGSLVKRPLSFFNDVLPLLKVECKSNNGFVPLEIKGPLQPATIEIDGSLSSQYLTGLLFAYSAANATNVSIHVNNLNSKPYIDLTLKVLKDFGLSMPVNKNYSEFYFGDANVKSIPELTYEVESDWSGGAFFLVAGVISGDITVSGLDPDSTQADKEILKALKLAGARMQIQKNQIDVFKSELRSFSFDATNCPDLFPPLVALASYCSGTTSIKGVHRLTHKESNRALTLQEEFGKLGIQIKLLSDEMLIEGGNGLKGADTNSHHDHRIAMACGVAGLNATGETKIQHAEAVNKSYPDFWKHMQQLNAEVSLNHN